MAFTCFELITIYQTYFASFSSAASEEKKKETVTYDHTINKTTN